MPVGRAVFPPTKRAPTHARERGVELLFGQVFHLELLYVHSLEVVVEVPDSLSGAISVVNSSSVKSRMSCHRINEELYLRIVIEQKRERAIVCDNTTHVRV